jgi:hypothetical protein
MFCQHWKNGKEKIIYMAERIDSYKELHKFYKRR